MHPIAIIIISVLSSIGFIVTSVLIYVNISNILNISKLDNLYKKFEKIMDRLIPDEIDDSFKYKKLINLRNQIDKELAKIED